MFEPTTLPMTRSGSPASDEPTATASSGELVPKATTVSPMTIGLIPKERASRDEPPTRSSPPAISRTIPRTKRTAVS